MCTWPRFHGFEFRLSVYTGGDNCNLCARLSHSFSASIPPSPQLCISYNLDSPMISVRMRNQTWIYIICTHAHPYLFSCTPHLTACQCCTLTSCMSASQHHRVLPRFVQLIIMSDMHLHSPAIKSLVLSFLLHLQEVLTSTLIFDVILIWQ